MGRYINQDSKGKSLPARGKLKSLLNDGAKIAEEPLTFQPNLVCVVNNGLFDAAAYCDTPNEFAAFNQPTDPRPKTWLVVDNAEQLAD